MIRSAWRVSKRCQRHRSWRRESWLRRQNCASHWSRKRALLDRSVCSCWIGGVVDDDFGVVQVDVRIPSPDGSVFGVEDEKSGRVVPRITNWLVGLATSPVGAEMGFGLEDEGGMVTTSAMTLAVPSSSVATPLPLSLIQNGDPGRKAIPQAFLSLGSVIRAGTFPSDTRLV
jgi:hypothetical protein